MLFLVKKNSNPVQTVAISPEELSGYGPDWMINPPSLLAAMEAGKDLARMKADDFEVVDLTQAELDALDAAYLEDMRNFHFARIDGRTRELIASGFEFPPASGKILSLSDQAQKNMLGVYVTILDAKAAGTLSQFESMAFPIKFNTLDDLSTVDIPDAATYANFYMSAFARVRALQDGGTVLKSSLRTATTISELEAVVDTRT